MKRTARRDVVAILTGEILSKRGAKDFLIGSEHTLCERFKVSRVTIRLALIDMEHRGLIYRRHGKGTFAYGNSGQFHRNFCVLIKSGDGALGAQALEIIREAGLRPWQYH